MCFSLFAPIVLSQSYNAEVLNYESSYTLDKNGLDESYSIAIKINNPQGDKYATIAIPYQWQSPVYNIEAWIEDINGKKIRKLKDKEIYDNSFVYEGNLFDDSHVKNFDLKYNVYPYIIKYKYSCNQKEFITICNWMPPYEEIPTHNAKLVITTSTGNELAYYQNKINPPLKDSSGHKITLIWEARYEQPMKPEDCSPPLGEFLPRVFAVPVQFNFGVKGNQQNWTSFGNWNYRLNEGLDDLPASEVQKVNELINGISDKRLIVKRLYEYLQDNTRYESVQIGLGGHKSYPASYVVSKKYGDCKALSNYMKALLKAAGIPSNTVLKNHESHL